MRMVDMMGNTTFEYDKNLYYLKEETLLIFHHPEKVIDNTNLPKNLKNFSRKKKQTLPAWDEYERVLRVTAFTDKQLQNPEEMEKLRHKSEKAPVKKVTDKERINQLQTEIDELKILINELTSKE